MTPTVDSIVASIQRHEYRYASEDELQAGLAAALDGDGFPVVREYRLDGFSRLDLFVGDPFEPGVAVEVKTAGNRETALRQVRRYIAYPAVTGVVLVTSRVRHSLPAVVDGKPVRVVQLALQGL